MNFSDLFKDKYKSQLIRESIEKMIREMSDLKRENYHTIIQVNRKKERIDEIKLALTELGIEVADGFDHETFHDED